MPLTDNQRAALRIIAGSPRGLSLSTLLARGFSFEMLQGLVRAGLATAHRGAMGAGKTKVAHLRITAEGKSTIGQ